MLKIAVLGSTGSIGRQALEIIRRNPARYRLTAIAAHSNLELLSRQAEEFTPDYVGVTGDAVPPGNDFGNASVLSGKTALEEIASLPQVDAVLYATTGFSGFSAVLAGIRAGKRILLANKETLVCGGELIMPLARRLGVTILPVDSEHSAVFQCTEGASCKKIRRVILTASGGAFRDLTQNQLSAVTAETALKHPNWSMGKKITVDCATMVNKGFEVIEAKWLFDLSYSQIECVIHRESIIHSMAEMEDGAVLAELSYPTMEIPISLALSYPERIPGTVAPLDFVKLGKLTFEAVDAEKYPAFALITEAGRRGGLLPAAMSGADEVLVEAFLQGKIKFTDIAKILEKVHRRFESGSGSVTEDSVIAADREARLYTLGLI